MKRLVLIPLVLVAAGALLIAGTGASNDDDGAYRVRAIFDNAFTLIPGLDVKIAGVRVGQIESLDVTDDQKAAVVLRIDDKGFQDFRTDAFCTIRPQGLIGEKFVECDATLPRREGAPPAPELSVVPEGQEGAGQRLLPVERTAKPVDIDLINDTLRLPYRERLSIIINELGTAVAGRGPELRSAVKRLNPGLRETGKVLGILAAQNRALADLAVQSDIALAPLSRERKRVAGFIEGADTTLQAQATASDALEESLAKLPPFLKELQPTMQQLESLADEAIPVVADLGAVAPEISDFIVGLGPFSTAAIPATKSLGQTADTGGEALIASKGTIDQIATLGANAEPAAGNLKALTESLEETGAFERILSLIFYAANSQNGFDELGYYARARVLTISCTARYEIAKDANCTRRIGESLANPAKASASARVSTQPATSAPAETSADQGAIKLPIEITKPSKTRSAEAPVPSRPPAAAPSDAAAEASAEEIVADYLLGDGS